MSRKKAYHLKAFAISKLFQKFYSNLAADSKKEKKLNLRQNKLSLQTIQSSTISKLFKDVQAGDIDNTSGRLLKDDADMLANPLTQICNSSFKLSHFPNGCKLALLKPLPEKVLK